MEVRLALRDGIAQLVRDQVPSAALAAELLLMHAPERIVHGSTRIPNTNSMQLHASDFLTHHATRKWCPNAAPHRPSGILGLGILKSLPAS